MAKSLLSAAKLMTNLIAVGKVVAPHGVRGELRIMALTDFPDRFESLDFVNLDEQNQLVIESVKYHKHYVLLKFKGYDSRNAIDSLCGKILYITRDKLMPLPEGRYYHFDLLGLEVFTEEDKDLGKLTEIIETGSNDVYVIESKQPGAKSLLIPALKEVVMKIDLENRKMVVVLQEEWDADAD
jgi:16S rRNA processing protein RimM